MSQDIFDDIHKDCQLSIFLLEKKNELLAKKLAVAVEALNEFRLGHEHNEGDKNYRPLGDNYGYCHTCATKVGLNEDIAKDALEQIEWMK
jgi:hypothetical protein